MTTSARPAEDPISALLSIQRQASAALRALHDGEATTGANALANIRNRAADVARHNIEDRNPDMPQMNIDAKSRLLALADGVANLVSGVYGRSRVGSPTYSAADHRHGSWSCVVQGMTDDVEVGPRIVVFIDGTANVDDQVIDAQDDGAVLRAVNAPEEQPPPGYEIEHGKVSEGDARMSWLVWKLSPINRRRVYLTSKRTRDDAIEAAAHDGGVVRKPGGGWVARPVDGDAARDVQEPERSAGVNTGYTPPQDVAGAEDNAGVQSDAEGGL